MLVATKRILLIISGGIAAYKSLELIIPYENMEHSFGA